MKTCTKKTQTKKTASKSKKKEKEGFGVLAKVTQKDVPKRKRKPTLPHKFVPGLPPEVEIPPTRKRLRWSTVSTKK